MVTDEMRYGESQKSQNIVMFHAGCFTRLKSEVLSNTAADLNS